ncbi:MAG: pantetheine-phosphate adenylyltransferase [Fusobacteriaceae bacterium]
MRIGVYSGSFDPITKGHNEIILRAAKLVEKLIVVVLNNTNKKYLFNLKEREEMVKETFKNIGNIEVKSYEGLLVDFLHKNNSTLIIRGLRSVSDYEYELTMAFANNEISEEEIETIFIPASKKYMYLSSTVVREIALNGGKLNLYLDEVVEKKIREKIALK